MLLKDTIAAAVAAALELAQQDGVISVAAVPSIEVERPNNPEHGDFATNLPLRLARAARANPLRLAELLAERVSAGPEIAAVSAAPPGFINFRLDEGWLQAQVEAVRQAGDAFGNGDRRQDDAAGRQVQVMVEFVSANPTGSRDARTWATRSRWSVSTAGSMRRVSMFTPPSSSKRLTPTTVRSPASTACWSR